MFKAILDGLFRLLNRFSPGLRDEYLRWRELIFSITTAQLEMVMEEPNTVYGVIMDDGQSDLFVITIVAWANGEASLKTTIGGGVIGLGFDESMKNQAKEIVKLAQSLGMNAPLVNSHEMPGSGRVRFYFLTTSGIRLSEFGLSEVVSVEHPFNGLFSRFGVFKNASDKIMDGWVPPSSKS